MAGANQNIYIAANSAGNGMVQAYNYLKVTMHVCIFTCT